MPFTRLQRGIRGHMLLKNQQAAEESVEHVKFLCSNNLVTVTWARSPQRPRAKGRDYTQSQLIEHCSQ